MKRLELRYIGEDSFGRNVYKDKKGYVYKCYGSPHKEPVYTAGSFEGEPAYPVDKNKYEIYVKELADLEKAN